VDPRYGAAQAQPGGLLHALAFGMQASPQGLLFVQVLQQAPPAGPVGVDVLLPVTRSKMPSPFVTRTTSPSRAVDQRLSLAGASTQLAGVLAPHFTLPSLLSNALTVFEPAPPIAVVSAATVTSRGWQNPPFVPSPGFPDEMTAYSGLVFVKNATEDDVALA
jgi:hypothetical protein